MRFYNYINEKNMSGMEITDILKKDCQPYLKDFKKIWKENFFYSGRGDNSLSIFSKKQVRKNRIPRDTPLEIHEFIDNWFYKKFGVKARSQSLFCYMIKSLVDMYGTPYCIIPINKYKVLTSPVISDLYTELEEILTNISGVYVDTFNMENAYNSMDDFEIKDFFDILSKKLESSKYILNKYMSLYNEYMIICDSVYLVNIKYVNIKKLFEEIT